MALHRSSTADGGKEDILSSAHRFPWVLSRLRCKRASTRQPLVTWTHRAAFPTRVTFPRVPGILFISIFFSFLVCWETLARIVAFGVLWGGLLLSSDFHANFGVLWSNSRAPRLNIYLVFVLREDRCRDSNAKVISSFAVGFSVAPPCFTRGSYAGE